MNKRGAHMNRTRMRVGVCYLAFAGLALAAVPALAQQDSASTTRLEKIEVTGSSIKRIDAETALPVQILTRQEIAKIGATTTEELLRSVTASTSFGAITVSQANGT